MEFRETQRLKLWWLYILVGLEMLVMMLIFSFGKHRITFAELAEINFMLLLAAASPLILVWGVQQISFKYIINERGISYKYLSLTGKYRLIPWASVNSIYIRKYDAMGEYGGWGAKYRLWFKMKDKAFIFNDENKGLQIEIKNGKKILFSTNELAGLQSFLHNFNMRYRRDEIGNEHV